MPKKKRTTKKPRKPAAPRKARGVRAPRIIDLADYSNVGRPTKYVPEFARVAETMALAGSTDAEIARACGVSVNTLYRWKADIPEFRESLKGAKQIPIERVERSLYHRAVGYDHENDEIHVRGQQVIVVKTKKHYPPDVGAGKLWLHNLDPNRWRPRNEPEPPPPSAADALPHEELTDDEIDQRLAQIAAQRAAAAKPKAKKAK